MISYEYILSLILYTLKIYFNFLLLLSSCNTQSFATLFIVSLFFFNKIAKMLLNLFLIIKSTIIITKINLLIIIKLK